MRLGQAVRRWAAPAGGLLGAAAICIACSSTTSGSPASSAGGAGSSVPPLSVSVSVPAITGIPSLTGIPSFSGIPSLSGLPTIGGDQADSAFCKDLSNFDPSSVTSDPSQALALYDKLAADAPAEIKPDVVTIRDFLHGIMNGNPSTSVPQNFSTAISHLGQYYAAHCAG